jgi:hypothetical protein
VVVVASSLANWERLDAYGDYQWVDYRRQDPERLIAMAHDLDAGEKSNSFNTRIVPQSFERLVVPGRVFLFTLVQLFFYSASIYKVTHGIVTGDDVNLALLFFSVISLGVSFWIVERILERRITGSRMTQINLGMAFTLNILILVMMLVQPLPAGYERDTGLILVFLFVNLISIFIFYRIGIYQIEAIMKWWLPPFLPKGKGRRNRRLYQVIFVSGLVTILLTVSFFGQDIPVSHARISPDQIDYQHVVVRDGLSLDVPGQWLEIPGGIQDDEIKPYILNAPISAVLVKANGPLNKDLALAINSYFQSPFSRQTLTIGFLELLGGEIEDIFGKIEFSLSPSSTSWRPDFHGSPVFSLAYVPEGKVDDTLIMTVWLYDKDAPYANSVQSVITNARTATNTQPIQQSILTPDITAFNSEVTAIRLEDDLGKTTVVVTLDSSSSDYFVTITGSDQVMQENRAVLEHILESMTVKN